MLCMNILLFVEFSSFYPKNTFFLLIISSISDILKLYKKGGSYLKKIVLLVLLLLSATYTRSYADSLSLSGEGAILIDSDTGQILYEKNPHKKLHPASTTKIMTAILALELGNMDDIVTVDEEVVRLTDGSHIALEPGEQLRFEDLVNALLIESANDSALAIAKHISGSIEEFARLMNHKAKELGSLNTNFVNPNGLTHEGILPPPMT